MPLNVKIPSETEVAPPPKLLTLFALFALFILFTLLALLALLTMLTVSQSVNPLLLLSLYMDFFKLLHGFIKVATWICYMDVTKLSHLFIALCQTKSS